MKRSTKNTLRAMAKHFGLTVKFVSYFGDDVHGKLLPRERRILINANKPRCEHTFTLLHELGHFVVHVLNPGRKYDPRLLDVSWPVAFLEKFASRVRRQLRFLFNKQSGKEWEADLWAMCAFVHVAKHIQCHDELCAFLQRHPEKLGMFFFTATGAAWAGLKRRVANLCAAFPPSFCGQ
jgi:hypothetical protein